MEPFAELGPMPSEGPFRVAPLTIRRLHDGRWGLSATKGE